MTENVNITDVGSAVVLDTRLPVGANASSTAWQTGTAQGALNLLVVDLICTNNSATATTFSLDAATAATAVAGVDGSEVVAVLGLNNMSGGFEIPTLIRASGATVLFTTAASTGGDTHRLTILYR
jgi:hypothetical protein